MCGVLDGDEMEEVLNSECKGDEMSKRVDVSDEAGDEKLVCRGCLHNTRGCSRGPGDH